MPMKKCQEEGKPGYKWGDAGKCYKYTEGDSDSEARAKMQARKQGMAIEANKHGADGRTG